MIVENGEQETEIELCRAAMSREIPAFKVARPCFGDRDFLMVEHDLCQRRMIACAFRFYQINDTFKWSVLVFLHREGCRTDAFKQG